MSEQTTVSSSTDQNEVLPVDVHRLAELFEFLGAEYALISKITDPENEAEADDSSVSELVLQTGLPHITIHIDLEDDILSAFATWEGRLATAEEERVSAVIAELNWEIVAPTLSYNFAEDAKGNEEILISANRAMAIGEGLSRNQLGMFIVSAFDSFASAFEALEEALPQAVTWDDETGLTTNNSSDNTKA